MRPYERYGVHGCRVGEVYVSHGAIAMFDLRHDPRDQLAHAALCPVEDPSPDLRDGLKVHINQVLPTRIGNDPLGDPSRHILVGFPHELETVEEDVPCLSVLLLLFPRVTDSPLMVLRL